ncbi:hypothetical protein [Peribacillus sp. V2I11]|uniref:hypothetical protein n=1 Tax=Peribacillus sp. V2I11 TaxID=3042277 RepID=UPI0027D81260|nr:hypothetical protein [Peribacillus sp. V2I11]
MLSRSLDEAEKDAHQRENKPGIREALKYILDNYQGARSEIFKNHVRNVIKKMIIEEADLDEKFLYSGFSWTRSVLKFHGFQYLLKTSLQQLQWDKPLL